MLRNLCSQKIALTKEKMFMQQRRLKSKELLKYRNAIFTHGFIV